MRKFYVDKMDWLRPLIRGKKVLDVGCIAHSLEEVRQPGWLHAEVAREASEVVGTDILQKEVEILRSEGHTDLVCADAETMDLGQKFDVIVMMDVIEHLTSPGSALKRVREHLEDGGIVAITTPNPINLIRFGSLLVLGKVDANPEHTCWFSEPVFRELARRCGLTVTSVTYVDDSFQYYRDRKSWWPLWGLNRLLIQFRPQMSETLGFILTRAPLPLEGNEALDWTLLGADSVLMQPLVQLFAGAAPEGESAASAIGAYSEVARGVFVGFEEGAAVHLAMNAPGSFPGHVGASSVLLTFSGASRWLTIEIDVAWVHLDAASQVEISLDGRSDRPVECRSVLRLPRRNEPSIDQELARFSIDSGFSIQRGARLLPTTSDADRHQVPRLLLFFDTHSDLALELSNLSARFG